MTTYNFLVFFCPLFFWYICGFNIRLLLVAEHFPAFFTKFKK